MAPDIVKVVFETLKNLFGGMVEVIKRVAKKRQRKPAQSGSTRISEGGELRRKSPFGDFLLFVIFYLRFSQFVQSVRRCRSLRRGSS